MNGTRRVMDLIKSFQGTIKADELRITLMEEINRPFFEYGGGADELRTVQHCWRGLTNVIGRQSAPKRLLVDLVGLATAWEATARGLPGGTAEQSLLMHNSHLVNRSVLEAMVIE